MLDGVGRCWTNKKRESNSVQQKTGLLDAETLDSIDLLDLRTCWTDFLPFPRWKIIFE